MRRDICSPLPEPGSPVTKRHYAITIVTAKHVFRASSKVAVVGIALSGDGSFWRLGKPPLDIVPLGER